MLLKRANILPEILQNEDTLSELVYFEQLLTIAHYLNKPALKNTVKVFPIYTALLRVVVIVNLFGLRFERANCTRLIAHSL